MATSLALTGRYYRIFPSPSKACGYAEETLELDLAETTFLIVDVYGRGFDDPADADSSVPDFYTADPETRTIVRDRIRPAKEAAKTAGLPVVYLTNHLSPGLNEKDEWRNMSVRTCDVDVLREWRVPSDVLAFSKVIAPDDDDILIQKQMYSGFFETTLDSALRARNTRNLVVVGFDSRICLGNTVTDAIYRGYRVVVLRDCVKTFEFPDTIDGQWANFMAIRYIETQVGYTATADEFISACKQHHRPDATV